MTPNQKCLADQSNTGSSMFPPTQWSVVCAVRDEDSTRVQTALESICRSYWQPLYTYLRRRGYQPADAEDLIQGFFEHLIERNCLKKVRQEQGRFRCFLLSCLRNFLTEQYRRASRLKRGGGHQPLSLDVASAEGRLQLESVNGDTPEQAFDRRWALSVIEKVLARLEAEAAACGKSQLFALLQGALTGSRQAPSYAEVARLMGVREGSVKMAVHRLRQRCCALFRQEIAKTVDRPEDVDPEIRFLFQVLSR